MEDLFHKICSLIQEGDVKISSHGYDELANDQIFIRDVVNTIKEGEVLEEYPDYPKGPCLLVLQKDNNHLPIHVVWGIPKYADTPAVLITAYRPDPEKWTGDFRRRKS